MCQESNPSRKEAMFKGIALIISIITMCLLTACDRPNATSSVTFAKVKLSPQELVELKRKAHTNVVAALSVSLYYQFTETNVFEAAMYMANVASLTGKPSDQYEAGMLLLDTKAKTNATAARKWLEMAACNGYKPAGRALEMYKDRFNEK
jgi:uncharacterized membrane protein